MRIYNNSKHIKHFGEISLNIGANEVQEDDWNKVEGHPIVKSLIEDDTIEVEEGDLQDITSIQVLSRALEAVNFTFDKEKLVKWLETETRTVIKEAIEKQIAYLNKKPQEDIQE